MTLAVLTYQRPRDLAAILPRLVTQALAVTGPDVRADVLVVDNDPDGGARDLVTSLAGGPVPIRYAHEATPGISAARNRALAESATADLLVYIDDDERPSERWLVLLLQTYREHRSAAVVGPVVSEFEVEPDPWIAAGRFFQRRRMPTGTPLEVAGTGNLLLDLHQIRRFGLTFDPDLGTTGGEDTVFTRQIRRHGGAMVWCDEAYVVDVVPASRLTRRWVLTRVLRYGISWAHTSLRLEPRRWRRPLLRLQHTASGIARVGSGAARFVAGVLTRSLEHQARGLRTLARGAGLVLGAWGYAHEEYRRPAAPGGGR